MEQQTIRQLLLGKFTFKRVVRSLIFIYACVCLYVWFSADGMIFLPQPSSYQDTNAASEPKLSLWVDGAGHNDLMWVAGKRYGDVLREFARLVEQV